MGWRFSGTVRLRLHQVQAAWHSVAGSIINRSRTSPAASVGSTAMVWSRSAPHHVCFAQYGMSKYTINARFSRSMDSSASLPM